MPTLSPAPTPVKAQPSVARIAVIFDRFGLAGYQLELIHHTDAGIRCERLGPTWKTPDQVREFARDNGHPVPVRRSVASLAHV
jgi:hypothetical protein